MPEIEHILLAIVKQKNNLAAEILNDYNLDYDKLHRLINQTTSVPTKNNIDFEFCILYKCVKGKDKSRRFRSKCKMGQP